MIISISLLCAKRKGIRVSQDFTEGSYMKKKELEQIWREVLELLESEMTKTAFETWVVPLKPINVDQENDKFIFAADGEMAKSILENRYHQTINSCLSQILPKPYKAVFLLAEDIDGKTEEQQYTPYTDELDLNPKYIFSTFVVGKNNQFAHAASLAVANNPSNAHNPLFLYGDAGLGKTHLMHAIGHSIRKNSPNLKVLYVSSEMFTNELIKAIRENRQMEFKNKYRSIDVFMLDDVQFIEGKDSTQEELFHTFNTLFQANKQIIFTSDKPPSKMKGLEERLTSRFGMGLVADIQPPDYETRVAILTKKAEVDEVYLTDNVLEVIHIIAEKIPSNIRELEGAFNRIIAYANLSNAKISKDLAYQVLQDVFVSKEKEITPDLIKRQVAKHFNVKLADFDSAKRSRNIAYPRQIAMYLCREMTALSLPKIGELFGGRDHTTVLHGCEKIAKDLAADASGSSELQTTIEALKNELKQP